MLIGGKKKPGEHSEDRNRSRSLTIALKKKKKFMSYQLSIYLNDFPLPEFLYQFAELKGWG